MKKVFEPDKKYLKIACYVLAVLIAAIVCEKVFSNIPTLMGIIVTSFQAVKKLFAPFLIGFFIAYLFNPLMMIIEGNVLKNLAFLKKRTGLMRFLSIFISYMLIVGCVVWMMTFFIPEVVDNLKSFFNALPQNLTTLEAFTEDTLQKLSINPDDVMKVFNSITKPITDATKDIPKIVQTVLNSTAVAASSFGNLIMGIIISFYMLAGKEVFLREIKKILYAFQDEKKVDHFLVNADRVNKMFKGFIVGKTFDSIIIGIFCFLGMTLMGFFIPMPFTLLISVIVGLTNMIPYFGPFIGGVPAVLIILLTQPGSAIWEAFFILALQQIDGNVIGPKILGAYTGMNPIWIIFSILVGGAVAGPLGMFLGVPICATVKMFFSEAVDRRYNAKYYYSKLDTSEEEIETKK